MIRTKIAKVILLILSGLLFSCGEKLSQTNTPDNSADPDIFPAISTFSASDPRLNRMGRLIINADNSIQFGYPGVSLSLTVFAQSLSFSAFSSSGDNYLSVIVDNKPEKKIKLGSDLQSFTIFESTEATLHSIRIVHDSETWHGITTLSAIEIKNGELRQTPPLPERKMIVIGDSITCGEGAERLPMTGITNRNQCAKDHGWWNAENSFGMQLANTFDAQVHLVCYGGRGLLRSWNGIIDEPQGPEFYDLTIVDAETDQFWDHSEYPADLVVVALGTNDFSLMNGDLPEKESYVSRYAEFANQILADYPSAKLLLTDGPMVNDDGDPSRPQRTVLKEYLKETQSRVDSERLQVFESSRFPGDECDGHPYKDEHRLMAEEMEASIKNIMVW